MAVTLKQHCYGPLALGKGDAWASTTLQLFRDSLHHGSCDSAEAHTQCQCRGTEVCYIQNFPTLLRPLGWICHQIWAKSRPHLLLILTLDISYSKHLSSTWLWWEWHLAPVSRDSPVASRNINVSFIFLHSLTLHSTNKWAMAPYVNLVQCTFHSVLQNSLAGLWPFAFVNLPTQGEMEASSQIT